MNEQTKYLTKKGFKFFVKVNDSEKMNDSETRKWVVICNGYFEI